MSKKRNREKQEVKELTLWLLNQIRRRDEGLAVMPYDVIHGHAIDQLKEWGAL